MESLATEAFISTEPQADVPVDQPVHVNASEEQDSSNATEKQSPDAIPDLSTTEDAPQLSGTMDVNLPEEHKKPEEQDINGAVDEGARKNCELVPDPGTAEVGQQVSEPMEMSVSDQVELLKSQPELDEANNPPERKESETDSATEKCTLQSLDAVPDAATAEANSQQNEPMDLRVSDQKEEEPCPGSRSEAVDEVTVSPVSGGGSLTLLSMQYRDDSSEDLSDSDSDSSSSSSTSSSSSSSGVICSVVKEFEQDEDQEDGLALGKRPPPVKTQDELLIDDLPAVETLNISLPENTEIEPIGAISSIVDQLVIVESKKDSQPLNDDSVLFNKDRLAVGRVFEVFGPVFQPYYILRFNSLEDIDQRSLKIGETIFFAPKVKDFTDYIFTEQLNKFKGSDASWKNDQEPPPEALDFSDDEEEKLAKQKRKEQRRQKQSREESDSENEAPTSRPQKPPRRKQNRNPQRGQPAHHNPRGGFHSTYHANPHFQSQGAPHFPPQGSPRFPPQGNPRFQPDCMFPPPGPFHPPFPGPGFSPYPGPPPPPPRMGMGPWPPGPYPGMMFHLPPPPPPPPPSN